MKAVHFGAGNIGRGFLGQLYFESGYQTTFIEALPAVVEALNDRNEYWIDIAEETPSSFLVQNVSAVSALNLAKVASEVASADICSTAVGVHALPKIVPALAAGLSQRTQPLDIIICENMLHSSKFLREEIRKQMPDSMHLYLDEKVGFVEASIGRMVPTRSTEQQKADPLRVAVEAYCELPVDALAFRGVVPKIAHLKPITPFEAYVERKLFIHNAGHATVAYLGFQKGYQLICDAVADVEIRKAAEEAMMASAMGLSRRYPNLILADLVDHVSDLLRRFANRALGDQVLRVGADPLRKLGPEDRFMGAIQLCLESNVDASPLIRGVWAALQFNAGSDPVVAELQSRIRTEGIDKVVQSLASTPEVSSAILSQRPK